MRKHLHRVPNVLSSFLLALLVACGGTEDDPIAGSGGAGGGGGDDCEPSLCAIDMCGVHDDGCGGELTCTPCLWDTVAELPADAALIDFEVGPGGVHWLIEEEGQILLRRGGSSGPVDVARGLGWVDLHFHDGRAYLANQEDGSIELVATNSEAVEALVSGEDAPVLVAADDDQVHWVTAAGEVARIPAAGGEIVRLREGAEGSAHPVGLYVDGDGIALVLADGSVFLHDHGEEDWLDASLNGEVSIAGTAVDPAWLYLADVANDRIVRIARTDGVPMVVLQGEPVVDLAVENGLLYWATSGSIRRMSAGGGEPIDLLPARREIEALLVQGGVLHWVDGGSTSAGTRSLLRLEL